MSMPVPMSSHEPPTHRGGADSSHVRTHSLASGEVFVDADLRTEWARACAAVGLSKLEVVRPEDGYPWHRYNSLIVHDLRRSAIGV